MAAAANADDDPDAEGELVDESLTRISLSPLDICFSQQRIWHQFQDGKDVEATAAEIEATQNNDGSWTLIPPFQPIRVMRWRFKLRHANGTPKLDAAGAELYGPECWVSLDNRRLYCLQVAATQRWEERTTSEVVEVKNEGNMARAALRKFKTTNSGRSVEVALASAEGESSSSRRWAWRVAVGLPDEDEEANAENADGVESRQRRNLRGGGRKTPPQTGSREIKKGQGKGRKKEKEDGASRSWDPIYSVIAFVAIYAGLRVIVSFVKRNWWDVPGPSAPGPSP